MGLGLGQENISGGGWQREIGQTVQRCNCGGAACKGAKVSAGTTSWPVDKLTGGQGSKYLAQRETGDRIVGWGHWVGLSREVVAVGGWERQRGKRMRCHRIPYPGGFPGLRGRGR